MSRDPAELLDVAAFVAQGSELEFERELKSFERIAPSLRGRTGTARGTLRFRRVAGFAVAEGHVQATLLLTCQRCLGEVPIAVDTACRLVFVEGDTAKVQDTPGYDVVMMQGGRASLAELVEDELLLALPLVAMHGEGTSCLSRSGADSRTEDESRQRPFAGLRELMKD